MPRYTVLKQYQDAAGIHFVGELTSIETAAAAPLARAGYVTPYNETPASTVDERLAAHDVELADHEARITALEAITSTTTTGP